MKHVYGLLLALSGTLIVVFIAIFTLKYFGVKGQHWMFWLGWVGCRTFYFFGQAFYDWVYWKERKEQPNG